MYSKLHANGIREHGFTFQGGKNGFIERIKSLSPTKSMDARIHIHPPRVKSNWISIDLYYNMEGTGFLEQVKKRLAPTKNMDAQTHPHSPHLAIAIEIEFLQHLIGIQSICNQIWNEMDS